jgi:uncharacterized protein
MPDLFTPLTEQEMDQLEEFLLSRIDENIDTRGKDEGIFDISTLDGFFTAIVSGPVMIPPSQWLPAVWGDFEPQWEGEKGFETVFSLLMRHMNGIASHLMNQPDSFEPVFLEHEVDGKTYTIVDEWCVGYMQGVSLASGQWHVDQPEMRILLTPIMLFGSEEGWNKLKDLNEIETENIRSAITANIHKIHAYWLARREPDALAPSPVRRSEPRVGRNDPCPCGSGKKYKKCCLH